MTHPIVSIVNTKIKMQGTMFGYNIKTLFTIEKDILVLFMM